jgi:hypothetical protein
MSRAERRYYEKELSKILKSSGSVCGICGEALVHNSQTYGGITSGNRVVLTGGCCVRKLEVMMGSGVYINKNVVSILSVLQGSQSDSQISASNALSTVRQMRSGVSALDKAVDDVMRKGGIQSSPTSISITDNPWKLDDAAWFKSHSDRSHRLRPLHPDEITTLPVGITNAEMPDNHDWVILVRQVKQGQRIRTAFCKNKEAYIPDVEEVIHVIFDIVIRGDGSGVISAEKVAALVAEYHIPSGSSRN